MSTSGLADAIRDNHEAIIVAVQGRMRGDPTMTKMAGQRSLSESDLAAQILGFWLQGIRSDVTLGSTAALRQNLQWLAGFREGHALAFDNAMVHRFFAEISDEIEACLGSDDLCTDYLDYRRRAEAAISEAFPLEQEVGHGA